MNERDQKIYKGLCDPVDNKIFVYVDGKPLDTNFYPLVFKPSFDGSRDSGFGWGRHGFESLTLSFAIIKDYTGDTGFAVKYYEDFERFVVSEIKPREWTMCGLYIKGWLRTFGGYDE